MSRDELGGSPWSAAPRAAPRWRPDPRDADRLDPTQQDPTQQSQAQQDRTPGFPARPAGAPDDVHDDLDAPPPGTTAERAQDGAPGSPGRGRRVGALLLAAGLGAGGALLAVRGSDADGAALVSLGSYPSSYSAAWAEEDELSLTVVVGNTGEEDLVVLAGGVRTAEGDAVGELEPSGFAAPRETGEGVADLPSGGTAVLGLTVGGSCEDPPAWDPWLRVRTPSGDTADVAVAVLEDAESARFEGFEDACTFSLDDQPFTPSVVGQRGSDEGLVLAVRNDTESPYGVEVLSGGVAGLELVDADVVLEPSSTTDVAVRVAPRSCESALEAPDLVTDVAIRATRSGDGQGASTVRLDLDVFTAGSAVGVGVGRACAAGA
ncbi:hypothetical protein [uncultured Pseudokineococcus sp.]|uniref:hypothetical protein n=1 Tax=uncultured Pseudokineococcus sp. TaxID=1642928 RepID=UPI00260C6603|nr:hypothetical protein [uncultured Pseudokineococcus sp.]